jgi:fructose-specific phosphotransferase system IIA component
MARLWRGIEMLLAKYMREDLILTEMKSRKKAGAIEELVELLAVAGVVQDVDSYTATILKREALESTAIGGGIAIPHGRSRGIKELKVAFARSKDGVNFKAKDNKPVYLIFMIAAPDDAHKEYLQIVAKIARLLKSRIMREALVKAETSQDVMELIEDFDNIMIEEIKIKTKQGRVLYGR